MKLVNAKSKIVGVRVGEVSVDLITGGQVSVNYVLLRDPKNNDGPHAGKYTKVGGFSEKTHKALENFIACLEDDALPELFEMKTEENPESSGAGTEGNENGDGLNFPTIPTLGDSGKSTPQI